MVFETNLGNTIAIFTSESKVVAFLERGGVSPDRCAVGVVDVVANWKSMIAKATSVAGDDFLAFIDADAPTAGTFLTMTREQLLHSCEKAPPNSN